MRSKRSGKAIKVAFCAAMLAASAVHAAETRVRLLVQSAPLAGLRYYEASAVWPELARGDELELVRDSSNEHDGNAIRVQWRGHMLGYVPRRANGTLSWALDRGDVLRARIGSLKQQRALRIEIEVFVE